MNGLTVRARSCCEQSACMYRKIVWSKYLHERIQMSRQAQSEGMKFICYGLPPRWRCMGGLLKKCHRTKKSRFPFCCILYKVCVCERICQGATLPDAWKRFSFPEAGGRAERQKKKTEGSEILHTQTMEWNLGEGTLTCASQTHFCCVSSKSIWP
jgi:hypothetical protein